MKEVSKEAFDTFYENNLETLYRVPKFDSKDCSVSWRFNNSKVIACKFVEYNYNQCKFFIAV
jgi:hypothetical protein